MELDAAERLRKFGLNRYEAVIAIAKYARRLNKERQDEKSEEEESESASDRLPKITSQALQDVLNGKVEFERTAKA